MKRINTKKLLTALVAIMLAAALSGCAVQTSTQAEGEAVPTTTSPGKLYENSRIPGVTFNENTLVFIEEMFDTGLINVYSNEANSEYTIASESMRDTYGDTCQHYLSEDVIASIRDDWQTESWNHLEEASFRSSQPQIIFTDATGERYLQFWLQAKLVGVKNVSSYMIFEISDEVVAAVQAQFNELPTRTSTRRTANETVELFFQYLNEQDGEKLNTLMAKPIEKPVFDKGVTDKLNTVSNLGHIGDFPQEWHEAPYANRVIVAKFTRTTNVKGGLFGGGKNSKEDLRWEFYLVRESADAEWKVAAYGQA